MTDLPILKVIYIGRHGWTEGLRIFQAQDFFLQMEWRGKKGYVKLSPRDMTRKGLLWGCAYATTDMRIGIELNDMSKLVWSWRRTGFWTKFAQGAMNLMAARDVMVL